MAALCLRRSVFICNSGQSHRLKISGYPEMDTIHEIDDFGGSRKNTEKIQKTHKIEDSGGTQKHTKNIQPETASGFKRYNNYQPEPISCLFLKQMYGRGLRPLPKRAAAFGRHPLLGPHLLQQEVKHGFRLIVCVFVDHWCRLRLNIYVSVPPPRNLDIVYSLYVLCILPRLSQTVGFV